MSDLLDSAKNQTYRDLEVVCVVEGNPGLLDDLNRLVTKKQMTNVRILMNPGPHGLCEARNVGILDSKGEIVAFADDDVVLAERWAEELIQTFTDKSIIAVTGSASPLWEEPSYDWFPKELDWLLSCTAWCEWNKITDVRNVQGYNMAFRRAVFERCGLFPTNLGYHRGPMSEDLGFSMIVRDVMRKRIVYNPRVHVFHKIHPYRLTWNFIAERSYWIGHSRRMLKTYYGAAHGGNVLSRESDLLKRIVTRTLPKSIRSMKKLKLISIVLLFATLGYLVPGIRLQGLRKFSKV
jgi:glycosyltransferase involved in cell wall biosynthesis